MTPDEGVPLVAPAVPTYDATADATVGAARGSHMPEGSLARALETARIGVWSWCPDTGVVEADGRVRELFGWEGDRPLRFPGDADERIHPADLPRVHAAIFGALDPESDGRFEAEYRVLHPDGSTRWILGSARAEFAEEEGARRAVRVLGTVADVTARNRALRHAELLLRTTSALAPSLDPREVAHAVTDRIIEAGGADAASFGVLDEGGRRVVLVDRRGGPEEWRERYATMGLDENFPLTVAVRTGEALFLDALDEWRLRFPEWAAAFEAGGFRSAAAIPCVVDGRVSGGIAIGWREAHRFEPDERELLCAIASLAAQALERARLLEAERAARAEAEAANRTKSEFLAKMSHELRTPLNAIQGYVQLLEMGLHGPISPGQRAVLGRVQRAQDLLLQHVNDVLDYARIEAGRMQYQLRDEDVGARLDEVVELFAPQFAAKRVRLEVRVPPGVPCVQADRDKLGQIFLNLLGNALKFTPTGGAVTAEVEHDAGEGVIVVRVADTGIGIAPDQHERIFEPFVQVDRSHRRPGEGTGLGLPISRELARGMGGDLTVSSRAGEGSVFALRLPVA